MKNFFSRKNLFILAILLVVLVLSYVVWGDNDSSNEETRVVTPNEFVQEVSVSGKVVAAEDVNLSFANSGRVETVSVKVGDQVSAGQPLLTLSTGALRAQLASAQADLALKQAEGANTAVNLAEVRRQQETLVASAYRQLLSDGLVAVPEAGDSSLAVPVITGSYWGAEGTYKIAIERDPTRSDKVGFRTFGLEKNDFIRILDGEPTPLGVRGLFISFPDEAVDYNNTIWYVDIPNRSSANYLANDNAFQEALRTRDKEIAAAEAELAQGRADLTVVQAQVEQARAEVARLQAEIADRTIRAPFDGVVTDVPAKLGAIANSNDPAVSMISAGNLELESFVPEINIPFIKIGDLAEVTLDAYGDDVLFQAAVISIDPAQTIRDGVVTYRIKLAFLSPDPRIKPGMTANLVITTARKSAVISVPQGLVNDREGKKFIWVKQDGQKVEREVQVGSVSSLGEIEIVSGLQAGDVIVTTPGA